MSNTPPNSVLIIASSEELPPESDVWGTGGWLEPSQREALDWLTLTRWLGWSVTVAHERNGMIDTDLSAAHRWIILACDPDAISEHSIAALAASLERAPTLVVARAAALGTPWARFSGVSRAALHIGGRDLRWTGSGDERSWRCRRDLHGHAIETSPKAGVWAAMEGAPWIVAHRIGAGTVATLAFHPGEVRDADGAGTALLKHLLIWGTPPPVAWLDFERTLVLRMDDPGSSENVHHRIYSHAKLDEAGWSAVGAHLRRHEARVSLGYVTGWVDDGDAARGRLLVNGREPKRIPGAIHPSPIVQYCLHAGAGANCWHDYAAEFRGIQHLRSAGLVDVELHGYTHIHPDTAGWAGAPDRYENMQWFRELGANASEKLAVTPHGQHPLALAMTAFQRHFGARPTTLISPGDQWTNPVLSRALELGLNLVSSYYLALRDSGRFCWSQHVCAPYLDQPEAAWFDSGLPVVGYFHDFDLCINGVEWFGRWLDAWADAGAQRMMDLRELAAAVNRRLHVEQRHDGLAVRIFGDSALELVRPLRVALRNTVPADSFVTVESNGRTLSLPVIAGSNGVCHLAVPPA